MAIEIPKIETPKQLLKRKAQEYIDRKQLLEQIFSTAIPTGDCYLVSGELFDRFRAAEEAWKK